MNPLQMCHSKFVNFWVLSFCIVEVSRVGAEYGVCGFTQVNKIVVMHVEGGGAENEGILTFSGEKILIFLNIIFQQNFEF